MNPIELKTKRLMLRRANEEDAKNLFDNYFSDNYSSHFLTRKSHTHVDQTKSVLNKWCQSYWDQVAGKFAWVIALKNTNEGIGVFLVELDDAHAAAQIHYGISRGFSNQGFITEAGKAVVQWLIDQDNIQRIWSVCDLSNIASARVLEKLGFQKEGVLKDWLILPSFKNSLRDCYVYAYQREEES